MSNSSCHWGDKCESLGLHPKLGPGYHIAPADGVFAVYMVELGIEPPPPMEAPPKKHWFFEGEKGKSTLSKWCCEECGVPIRYGRQGDPELIHVPCTELKGEAVTFIRGDIYDAKKTNN